LLRRSIKVRLHDPPFIASANTNFLAEFLRLDLVQPRIESDFRNEAMTIEWMAIYASSVRISVRVVEEPDFVFVGEGGTLHEEGLGEKFEAGFGSGTNKTLCPWLQAEILYFADEWNADGIGGKRGK